MDAPPANAPSTSNAPASAADSTPGRTVDWRIGTMSFSDPAWSGPFYPEHLKSGEWLSYYSRHFNAVELDTTFYAVPPPERVARWRDATPDDFRFALKTPRAITHDRPLPAGVADMQAFLDVCRVFEQKLGVILIQFAPSFTAEQFGAVDRFLGQLPDDLQYAVEFRHRSWGMPETLQMLHERGASFVSAEYATRPSRIFATADFVYLRFIGEHDRFAKHDREQIDVTEQLSWWQQAATAVMPKVQTIWGLFNNDYAGYSPATANRFKRMIGLPTKEPTEGKTFGLFE